MDLMSIIVAVVLGYFLVMFILHELFKKFFHTILFFSFILLMLSMLYFFLKGI